MADTEWVPGFTPDEYRSFAEEMGHTLGELADLILPNTLTSLDRILALRQICEYANASSMEGVFIECGVWRGGSTMLAAATFQSTHRLRGVEVFDTFDGMTEPSAHDVDWTGRTAASRIAEDRFQDDYVSMVVSRQTFDRNFSQLGYPPELLTVHEGDIRQTITRWQPKPIVILRLDTDWYETTKLELSTFWDHIVPGGFVLVDDYGYWQGARQATDEFVAGLTAKPLILRIDHSGVLLMKPPITEASRAPSGAQVHLRS